VASNSKDARQAMTHFEVIGYKKFSISNFQFPINDSISNSQKKDAKNILSYLKINLETGRTHQIRAHFFAIGYPVVGDSIYKSRDSEVFSKKIGLNRQFLHASELSFKHPVTGKKMDFKSKLPEDLKKFLK
jgi:23S rRNA pseudouridine1911/1915/1917 synthase